MIINGRGDTYYAHGVGTPAWIAIIARYLLGGRCLLKLRAGVYVYERNYAKGFAGFQFRSSLQLADRIFVVNRELEFWLQNQGVQCDRIIYTPNSVDVEQFRPAPFGEKDFLRKHLNLPTKRVLVLFVGRLSYYKGVDILFNAWSNLPEKIRNTSALIIVGDGDERQNLDQLIKDLNIGGSVYMMGMQNNTRDYYWASDIFVLPSRTEGLSNAQIEAMACDLPCIVSSEGGSIDPIEDGKNGLIFSNEDHVHLSQQLAKLIRSKPYLKDMGHNARGWVIENANISITNELIRKIIFDLI